MHNLSGKTAVVTGASRGIGRLSALALAARGARVLVHYAHRQPEADAVVRDIRQPGGWAEAVAADLAISQGPHQLAQQVRSAVGDRLDILVLNAGVTLAAELADTALDDFDRLFAINVRAPFFLVQQTLPLLAEGGSIIFVSSVVARNVFPRLPAYAATKGAIDTLVKHLAAALGTRGLRVNAGNPSSPARRSRTGVAWQQG